MPGEQLVEPAWGRYPPEIVVSPGSQPPRGVVQVPPSKSITNRALVLAALASPYGPCLLQNVLRSEDTEVMLAALQRLGFAVAIDWPTQTVRIGANTSGRRIPASSADIFVANSGTTMRFVCAMAALGEGSYRFDGVPRMRERPIQDLLDALNQLDGVEAVSLAGNGCPPVAVTAAAARASRPIRIRATVSSQFLSGLLMAAPYIPAPPGGVVIQREGPAVSEPYITMTINLMQIWGHQVEPRPDGYAVTAADALQPTPYRPAYTIEPDASAASYFWAAAAVTGGSVTVADLTPQSLQGDVRFVELLAAMGCRVEVCASGITVHGGRLRGIDADMNAISDTVMTLAAVACCADGPTRIRNVAHIRHKETDRISALANELRKIGAAVDEHPDGLTIHPRPLRPATLDTYNDHRMAMSLALIGLRVPGIVLRNPGCVAKTYPQFWEDWKRLAHLT